MDGNDPTGWSRWSRTSCWKESASSNSQVSIPGSYVVFVEPISSSFTGGSGVGPFQIRFDQFPKDYYNGDNESGIPQLDDPAEKTLLLALAGQPLEEVILRANEGSNNLASLTDDDQELFTFPQEFTFPFFGKIYELVTVNSDGNPHLWRGRQ